MNLFSKEKGIIFSALNAILIIWIIATMVMTISNITTFLIKDYEYTYEEYKISYCDLKLDIEETCKNDYINYQLDRKSYDINNKRELIISIANVILVSVVLIVLNQSKKK